MLHSISCLQNKLAITGMIEDDDDDPSLPLGPLVQDEPAHDVQTRSDVGVGATACCCPAPQTLKDAH